MPAPYTFFMYWAADFSMSRLVPTVSKAISTRASYPMGVTLVMRPLPKALCWTLSPARKAGAAALGALPAAGL